MRLKVGLLLLSIFFVWRFSQFIKLSFFRADFQASTAVGTGIAKVIVPRVSVDLVVSEVAIKNGWWEIPEASVGHLITSAKIGGGGNIVLYAHNTTRLFGPIRWLDKGDGVILVGTDGKEYHYRVTETVTVLPNNLEYVLPKNTETLTLFTCTGIFDSQRFIVVAKPLLYDGR